MAASQPGGLSAEDYDNLRARIAAKLGDDIATASTIDSVLADIMGELDTREWVKPVPLAAGAGADKRTRIVITGMGTVNPLGNSIEEYWGGLKSGTSGIARMTLADPSAYPTQVAAEVKNFNPKDYMDFKDARRMSRASHFAVAAARMAIEDADLTYDDHEAEEIGVLLGTGNGAFADTEEAARTMIEKGGNRISPFALPIILPNMPACQVAIQHRLKGYTSTVVTACAAGTQAIGEAAEVIRRGEANVMLCGGTEAAICELGLATFCAMRAMTTHFNDTPERASRPFDKDRDGFTPAEGAGIIVIESLEHALARNAHIYAEIVGYGSTCDAYHVTAPDPDGLGAVRAMRKALHMSGLAPRDVDYINAHATATPLNDKMETLAIKKVFGDYAYSLPVNSTKSMIGHLLGAAGGVESIAIVLQMQNGLLHPTINLDTPDPECDLDYVPNVSRPHQIKVAMSNSFGFGGQNASLIIKEYIENTSE